MNTNCYGRRQSITTKRNHTRHEVKWSSGFKAHFPSTKFLLKQNVQ